MRVEEKLYRKGMDLEKSLWILEKMAENNVIDKDILLVLKENYNSINSERIKVQNIAVKEYNEFIKE